MTCPLDYSLCNQTVTIYRKQNDQVLRTVLEGCFYTWQTEEVTDVLGRRQTVKFLLIVPGENRSILPGDRVFSGVGPAVTLAQWPGFLPVTVPTLAQVQYVKPCFWEGTLCHIEAGRK